MSLVTEDRIALIERALSQGIACLLFSVLIHGTCLAQAPTNPGRTAPDQSEDLILGRYVYTRNCQICHGARGDGKGEWSPGLSPQPRSFRAAHFKYRSTPFGKLPLDEDLRRTIRGGRSNTAMGMFTRLSERELDAVIAYLKTFSRKWRDPALVAPAVTLPAQPSWFDASKERALRVRVGAELFTTTCAPCHGLKADGKGPQAEGLVDVHGRPIKPADLLTPHLRNGNAAEDLMRVLLTGLNGTPMISFAESFSDDELWAVVAYLLECRDSNSSLPKRNAAEVTP